RRGHALAKQVLGVVHVERGAEELQRIANAIAYDGVDDQTLLVGRDDLLLRQVEADIALVVDPHILDDGRLEMQSGLRLRAVGVDDTLGLVEAQYDRLLVDAHDIEGVGENDDGDREKY